MRYYEISSGFRVPVNQEEQAVFDRFEDGKLYKHDLDERGQEVARLMVTRGLLDRRRDDDGIFFAANDLNSIWRL